MEIYAEDKRGRFIRDFNFVIKVAHKDEILRYINFIFDNYDEDRIKEANLYVLPVYFSPDAVIVDSTSDLVRINSLKKWSNKTCSRLLGLILESVSRFAYLNYWILNKVEDNESFDFGDGIHTDIVSYVKHHATSDKKIKIDMSDITKGAYIKIKPSNRNIYNHSNHIIRTMMDYKTQVVAHYQGYWCGSSRNGTLHLEQRWKEAYDRNGDKPYKLIKERENVEVM